LENLLTNLGDNSTICNIFLGEMLKNGQKSAKFVSISAHTAAHISKSISILKIPGMSKTFWYKTFQNLKMAVQNKIKTVKFKNQ